MDRHLSPAETARRFGVSIKALRLYEQRGLLTPLRSEAGWRTYGPDQVARLHQILTLKRLGLKLARIGELLDGPGALETVLALQEQILARDSEQLSRALVLVRAARAKLKAGQALSIDDLATLNQETVMASRVDAKEMKQLFTPFGDRHISPEEKETIRQKLGGDRDQVIRTFNEMIAEGEVLMRLGDPTSPGAQDLVRRWAAMAEKIKGISTFPDKAKAVWKDAMDDPVVAERMALNRKIFAFLEQAMVHFKSLPK